MIDAVNQAADACIEFIELNTLMPVEGVDNFLGDDLDCCFHIHLVLRAPSTSRQRGVVLLEEFLVDGVDLPVAVSSTNCVGCCRSIIRHDDFSNPTEVFECLDMCPQPCSLSLVRASTGKQHAGIRQ